MTQAAISIADLRREARRRLPRSLFDFIDGGAEDEVAVRNNRAQFDRWALIPRVAVDVAVRTTAIDLFDTRVAAPLIISATGMPALHRGRGDVLLARAARRFGVPMMLSTVSTASIEDVAAASDGPLWFQLYVLKDRAYTLRLIERARHAGYAVLVATLDVPVAGQRERDLRNGFVVPLRVGLGTMLDLLRRGPWLLDQMRHGVPTAENMREAAGGDASGQALAAYMSSQVDPTVTWDDVTWLRQHWRGPLLVKGILAAEDAAAAIDRGVDGIIVSNHGGRQLDGAVPTLEALAKIADRIGNRATILCDGGFQRGTDVAKALALGARAVSVGRATLFGLAAGGEDGVFAALTMLATELDRAMALLGCRHPGEIDQSKLHDLGWPTGRALSR